MNAKGGKNPFFSLMETPNGDSITNVPFAEKTVARESLTLLAPMQTPFRHIRFKWMSNRVVKMKEFLFKLVVFKRRNQ